MEENKFINTAIDIAQSINEDFNLADTLPKWNNYLAVSKFKSVRRAIKRGHLDLIFGIPYPSRPFNNRKSTIGRSHNQKKKRIYGQLKRL